jgi:hypothetical protein
LGELTVRIYLDSTSIIYLIEGVMPFATAVESRLAKPEVMRVTSDLARLECQVQPFVIRRHQTADKNAKFGLGVFILW